MDDLFSTLHRTGDPRTSVEAAAAVAPRVVKLRLKVLEFAAREGGMPFTDRQLEQAFGNNGSTYRSRRAELTAMGLIADTGMVRQHGTSRRHHIIWRITDRGLRALRETQFKWKGKPEW